MKRWHTNARTVATALVCAGLCAALAGCGCAGPFGHTKDADASADDTETSVVSANGTDTDSNDGSGSATGSESVSDATAADSTLSEDGRLDLLVLVNKEYGLPEGWEEKLELVEVTNCKGYTQSVDRITMDAFNELQEDLQTNEGITIDLNSGYRSTAEQQEIMDYQLEVSGEDYVRDYVAKPGYSEHQTGLALDVLLVVDGTPVVTTDEIMAAQDRWDVIHAHLARHGFILRYLDGREDVTGYYYEPWHIRYVGVEAATHIMDEGITLEEYLGKVPDHSVAPGAQV